MGFGDPDHDDCGGNGGANPGSSSQLADKVDSLSLFLSTYYEQF